MKRVLTAAVAVPIVLLLTFYSPPGVFAGVIGIVAAAAVDEFASLGAKKGIGRPAKWFLILPALVSVSFLGGPERVIEALIVAALVVMSTASFGSSLETALGEVAIGLSGLVYCAVTLGFLVLMQRQAILLLFAIIWVGDSAAYYGGRAFGRHLLAPRVSPKKTVEGAVAGLLASILVGVVGGKWVMEQGWMRLIVVSAVTAIAGQIGDLAESVLKRSAGVKDSSSILPGHGGILDRLDSLFFAAPVFYWLLNA
jgi:phosphatidate cytidylyltransferase